MSVTPNMLTIKNFFKKTPTKICCDVFERTTLITFMAENHVVTTMLELFSAVRKHVMTTRGLHFLSTHGMSLYSRGKLLNATKSLCDYSWAFEAYNPITLQFYSMMGGSNTIENYVQTGLVSYSVVLERAMLNNTERFVLQSSETDAADAADAEFAKMCKFLEQHISHYCKDVDLLSIYENLWITFKLSRKCTNTDDYVTVACTAYKLFTNKSYTRFVTGKVKAMFSQVQAGETGTLLSRLRGMMNLAEEIGENPFYKKVTGLYSYLLVQGFLTRFGLELNDEDYSRMEQRALCSQFSSRKNLWVSVLDTTLFICERIHEWKLTGDVSVFLHSEGDYGKWLKEADRLLALGPFTGNLEAHGTTYFSFVADLNEATAKGEAYCKFSKKSSGTEVVAIQRKYNMLMLMKNTEVTKRAAQKERKAPFGVLVHGGSSVGKSSFTKMLYYYYGSLMGLKKDDHFRYTRNPADEYWSNFDSSMWCIQLDEVGFLLPKKSTEVDPTLKELLNVVNNVPYVPTQADLADKGKTPVLAKLVVATSNAANLNAHEYFWCPLAVQRRLPFVVEIKPKKEFLAMNQKFLDPSKLPKEQSGYPNYWDITVCKVTPYFDGERDLAQLEEVCKYTDVNDFLVDFGKMALKHEGTQDMAMGCDEFMRDVDVCVVCHRPGHTVCGQVQADETIPEWIFSCPENSRSRLANCFAGGLYWWYCALWRFYCWCIQMRYIMSLIGYAAQYSAMRGLIFRYLLPTLSVPLQVALAGRVNGLLTGPRKWKLALGMLSLLGAAITLYMSMRPKNKKEAIPMETQGNKFSTTEVDLKKEERTNVWYNPTLELTKFDIPLPSQSLKTSKPDEVRDLFSNNCVRLLIQRQVDGEVRTCSNAGIFLKGHMCMTNNHAFKGDSGIYRVTIIKQSIAQGLNSNITITVRENDLIRRPESDIVMFDVQAMPPHKDITKFWDFSGGVSFTKAIALRRQESGELECQEIFNLTHTPRFPIEGLDCELPISLGKVSRNTVVGDCGAIYIAMTPRGPVIFGLHVIGHEDACGAVCIDAELIEAMFAEHAERFGKSSQVQGGGEPQLVLDGTSIPLTVPHHKSLFRYLEDGTANIYGSFAGFRPKPKSGVCATPLQSKMLDHFGTEVKHGKPCMEGWEPWRKNIVEMVKPDVTYRKDVLAHAVQTFTADILAGLPTGWEKQLVFLSDRAAVNGVPGVRFIDRLNTNTSMGFPWNCTKKRFLHSDITEDYSHGVDFDDAVWERVRAIETLYAQGKRAYPVFTGHLKDEPVTYAKIEAKKTRVFTGAPVDWSIVVRSRLLPFVKLLQENKMVFEAGPGTVCQSNEWGQIYEYLTTFGTDRIVAGDYGKFDKRMIADFVLAAFNIIASTYEAAGFEQAEIREILCIGEDTAFPLTNMNGDLVEFFGTNPSGHPLTVIINSLVNSLYIRYCYVLLNPKHESRSFKSNVRLFTYGDDNIMGVSRSCDWFNHTAIQHELANIGVEYTMADKEAESVPFINVADCQFLKRKWRFDEDVQDYLCPLEEESIHKSLTVWCPSGTLDEYAQMVAVISSANSEYFFYGRTIFEKHHNFFKQVLSEEPYNHYVGKGTLPTWEQLHDRFVQSSQY